MARVSGLRERSGIYTRIIVSVRVRAFWRCAGFSEVACLLREKCERHLDGCFWTATISVVRCMADG